MEKFENETLSFPISIVSYFNNKFKKFIFGEADFYLIENGLYTLEMED